MAALDYSALAKGAERLAREAGAEIMRLYREGTEARFKADASPVTEADEIADRLSISAATVKTHISHVLNKLGLTRRTQAVLYALKHGIATLEDDAKPTV